MGKKKDILKAAINSGKLIDNSGMARKPRAKKPGRVTNLKPFQPGQTGNPNGRPPKTVVHYVKKLKALRDRYTDGQIQGVIQNLFTADPLEVIDAIQEKRGTALEILIYSMWATGVATGDPRITFALLQIAGHGKLLKEQPMELPPDDGDGEPQAAVMYLPVQRPET